MAAQVALRRRINDRVLEENTEAESRSSIGQEGNRTPSTGG